VFLFVVVDDEEDSPMAGYSGTPLLRKLGIKDGHALLLLGAPKGFGAVLDAPDEVEVSTEAASGPYDVIVWFTKKRAELAHELESVADALDADGGLWVAWPKKASGVKTDVTEDVIRSHALALGLVDNKVCAIDDTWSGLRLVVRVGDRLAWRARRA
jgi:hypothetical protein